MDPLLSYFLIALLALAAGFFIGQYIQNLKTRSLQGTLQERADQLQQQIGRIETVLSYK